MLWLAKSFLSIEECDKLDEFFSRKELISGGIYDEYEGKRATENNDLRHCLTSYHSLGGEIAWFCDKVERMNLKLAKLWRLGPVKTIEELKYIVYRPGHHFQTWHADNTDPPTKNRIITFSGMLSSKNSFTGGELLIKKNNEINSIELKKGDFVFFHSGYVHKVDAVKSGERKVVVNWTTKDCE